jgi:Ca-activated chloride channel family protein
MSFAHPPVLLLLLLLPCLAGLKVWGDLRSKAVAGRMASPRLLPGLLIARGKGRGWLVLILELAALAAFIIALARPQYGYLEEETGNGGRSLIIAIDTSRSMLTDDLKPSRLVRTQLAATDLVKRLRGDRVGLMPFAGSAFMYAPITPDIDALLESMDSLDTEIIPRGGSNLSRPIDLAIETFAKAGTTDQQVLILFSDGENLEGSTLAAAQRARDKKLTIITIGVGTQNGAIIPDPEAPGGFYRDPEGKLVVSRLEREALDMMARTTGGLYLTLDGNGINDSRIDVILDKLKRTAMKGKVTRKALDRYQWPLGAGLLLLLSAWLAGIATRHRSQSQSPPLLPGAAPASLIIALLVFTTIPGVAAPREKDKKAPPDLREGNPWAFYQKGEYEAAQHNFKRKLGLDKPGAPLTGGDPALEFGRGAAAFKNKDYDSAVDAFGSAVLTDDVSLRAQSHYNLANAIYERTARLAKDAKPKTLAKLSFIDGLIRQLENSLENYQQALVLSPDHPDFKANHDTTDQLIQKLREIRKKMAEQQGQGQGEGKDKKKGKKGKGESPGQGQGKGQDGEGGTGPNGEEEGEGEGGNGQEKEGGSGPEGEEEKAAREKSNEDKDGKIAGQNQPGEDAEGGKEPGKEPGKENGGENGKEPGKEPGEPDENSEADNEVNPETGFSAAEAKNQLDRLSDEDMKVRPRIDQVPERRPAKDW